MSTGWTPRRPSPRRRADGRGRRPLHSTCPRGSRCHPRAGARPTSRRTRPRALCRRVEPSSRRGRPTAASSKQGSRYSGASTEKGLGDIAGLSPRSGTRPLVAETYPRYVIRTLWPDLEIPSKRKEPERYMEVLSRLIQEKGYAWDQSFALRVDIVDAMVCALVAEACLGSDRLPEGTVGLGPEVHEPERVLREGGVVSP